MSALCPLDGCGRPSQDGAVCAQHTWALRRDLAAAPELLVELDVTVARQAKAGPVAERVTGKGAHTPLAFGYDAADAYTGLRDELVGWARVCGLPWCEYATTASGHLHAHLEDLRIRGDAARLWGDLGDAFARARQAIDAPADRTRFDVGPCPEHTPDGGPCPGTVRVHIPADDRPPRMSCGHGHSWTSPQFYRAGKRIRDLAERRARALAVGE